MEKWIDLVSFFSFQPGQPKKNLSLSDSLILSLCVRVSLVRLSLSLKPLMLKIMNEKQ